MPVRTFVALAAVLLAAALVSSARARSTASATASAAVVSGSLGRVAPVKASGNDAASSSISSRTPKGISLGDGVVSVTTSLIDHSAVAQAEADDLSLFDDAITASLVSRTAEDKGTGVKYHGSVVRLVIEDKKIGTVSGNKTFKFSAGKVVVGEGGAGMTVTLTSDFGGAPAGTRIVIADVAAHAVAGSAPPAGTATATPTAAATATPAPTATPKPKPKVPSYKTRLMKRSWVFPVGGKTTIGGPFGAFRSDTGFHEGNDLFADFGTPVVAVSDGTVQNVGSLPISGNRLWVYADSGDQFFYAHLSAFSPEAVDGAHVDAGTILGYVGNTGDAEPTPPHLHFEIHPDGGKAVDPNPFLVAWQKRAGATALRDTTERPGALVEVRDFIGEG